MRKQHGNFGRSVRRVNTMNRRIIIFCLSSFSCSVFAQDDSVGDATVSGRLVDRGTLEPVPFVTVTVKKEADGVTITGALTEESGRFIISGLAEGSYILTSALLGYQSVDTPVLVGDKNNVYDLGDIGLAESGDLEEVVVVAQQQISEASLDRRVFSLEDNIAQGSGSLLDAMRGLPGVTVDQEGKVLLRGSDRVAILVDGRQSSLTGFGNQSGLDSVPAANIESIEIINNPSSRYDSAGMAGIINIVYKREQEEGLHVDAGVTIGTGQLSKRKDDLPTDLGSYSRNPKITPSVNLVNNTENINAFFQGQILFQEDIPNNEFTSRFYDDGRIIYSQVPENREQTHIILNGGLDKFIDEDRTLTFSSILDFETHTDVAQVPFIDGGTGDLLRYWFWQEEEDTGFFNVNLDYERRFEEPGHQYSLSFQYTRGWEDEAYFLNEISPVRVGTDATHLVAEENTLPIEFDYVRPLRSGRLEAGGRVQKRWIPITYDVMPGENSVIYPGLGDWSEWGEEIYAGYVNYVHEKERYDIEAGIRAEHTDVYYDLPPENIYYDQSDSYDYFELYPNVRLTYNINDLNHVSMHFNNRVDRPGEPELRIFPKYDDPELLKVGNPYLRPQFTETFEIAYERLWDTGSAIVSAYHRNIDDPFTRVFAIDPTNQDYDIINRVYQNVGSGSNTGLELILIQDVGENWELSGSVNWYDNVIDADVVTLLFPIERPFIVERSQDNTWDFKINNLFELPRGLEFQVSVVYYAEKNIAQGRQAARSSVDLGVSKSIMDDRAEIVFSVVDLFNDFGIKQFISGDGFDAIYENYYETQVLSLGFNYQF